MLKFSIRSLLMIVTIVAILIWWNYSGFRVIHRESSVTHGSVSIYGKKDIQSEKILLRVQYSPPSGAATETHLSPIMELDKPMRKMPGFNSIVDKTTGLWCIYDTDNQSFVFLCKPPTKSKSQMGQFWHPGIHMGWGRGYWAKAYRTIKPAHQQIPYVSLPGEMKHSNSR